jgi:hypothetical protein
MTEALSRGEWIGDYAVGTHGFLFKLPVAIIFLFTGSSLAIATVWNILLACISLFVFYKILEHYFPKTIYPFLGSLLMLCNFQFILNLPTYMREFPVLLGFLIFLYVLIKKKSLWLVGLSLLLILDGKEYVLFMIAPALIIYFLIKEWKGFNLKTLWNWIKDLFKIFLPTVLFLLLMIFTSIIPLNMYGLSVIPGITKGGVEYQIRHFEVEKATTNRIEDDAPTVQKEIEGDDTFLERVYKGAVSYLGKILYPRSFSFLSIPKMIFLPSFLTAIFLFSKKLKKKDNVFISFALIFFSFITVFILRASFDRYLFPILPIVIFFFLIFIKDIVKKKKEFFIILFITTVISFIGLLFEVDYLWIKIVLNIIFFLLFFLYYIFSKSIKKLYIPLLLMISLLTFSVVVYFFYANGQLYFYRVWGKDYEVKEVVSYFEDDERIMLNDPGWDILVEVYRGDNRYNPEWKWELAEWIPRKKNLKMFEKYTSFDIYGKPLRYDLQAIESFDIEKIGLIVSTVEGKPFPYQERLDSYMDARWLELIESVNLKNKELYIFKVNKEYFEQ